MRHAALRVNLTVEVPEWGVQPAPALRDLLYAAFAGAYQGKAASPWRPDRIEPASTKGEEPSLLSLAARRGVAQTPAYVDHGSLRVPAFAERDFRSATRYLGRDSVMRHVLERVEHSRTEYTLRIVHNGADRYEPDTHTVVWDPLSALRTTAGGRQSPALGLGHELAHAAARPARFDAGYVRRLRAYDNAEERRVIRGAEAHAARTLGEATRWDHRGTAYRVASPVAS